MAAAPDPRPGVGPDVPGAVFAGTASNRTGRLLAAFLARPGPALLRRLQQVLDG